MIRFFKRIKEHIISTCRDYNNEFQFGKWLDNFLEFTWLSIRIIMLFVFIIFSFLFDILIGGFIKHINVDKE